MDPLSALGLAGNIAQFLDFSFTLCSTFSEICKSAKNLSASSEHAESRVTTFMDSLDLVSDSLDRYEDELSEDGPLEGIQDTGIKSIVEDCREVAADLQDTIDKLRPAEDSGKWKKFAAAIRQLWSDKRVQKLLKRLSDLRSDLTTRTILLIHPRLDLMEARQKDQFEHLSAVQEELLKAMSPNITTLPPWPRELGEFAQEQSSRTTRTSVFGSTTAPGRSFAQQLANGFQSRETDILRGLSFPVMKDREDEISEAAAKTLEWIFRDSPDQTTTWTNFTRWLESGDSLYWVSGKAGSGKSTLMKHISSHKMTSRSLQVWAAESSLQVASFFFWNGGSELQKSQEGLLRSLLHECVHTHRELIPYVFEDVYEINHAWEWTHAQLARAWNRLISQKVVRLRICLFVDGLDEYEGNDNVIVELFQNVARNHNIKVCVSSRPQVVFVKSFGQGPKLELQDLTANDIRLYVESRLQENRRMMELEKSTPYFTKSVISTIRAKASGVFLWVRLVVNSLLEGLDNGDTANDLQTRLDDFPDELEQLFQHMLNRISHPRYREQCHRFLQLVKHADGCSELSLLQLYFAEQDSEGQLENDLALVSPSELRKKFPPVMRYSLCMAMTDRIRSRCLGLVEVVPSREPGSGAEHSRVVFHHKSVLDFLNTLYSKPGASTIKRPTKSLMRATLLELKFYKPGHGRLLRVGHSAMTADLSSPRIGFAVWTEIFRPKICDFLVWAALEEQASQLADTRLVDELEVIIDSLELVRFQTPMSQYSTIGANFTAHRDTDKRGPHAPRQRAHELINSFADVTGTAGLHLYYTFKTGKKWQSIDRTDQERCESGQDAQGPYPAFSQTETSSTTMPGAYPGPSSASRHDRLYYDPTSPGHRHHYHNYPSPLETRHNERDIRNERSPTYDPRRRQTEMRYRSHNSAREDRDFYERSTPRSRRDGWSDDRKDRGRKAARYRSLIPRGVRHWLHDWLDIRV